jgi:N-methylhydantoinase A
VARDFTIAVDIGGTFTDLIAYDADGARILHAKSPTTPHDLAEGILACVAKSGGELGEAGEVVHGSTVAINTVLEEKGASTALVVTEGTRDVYAIGRGNRPDAYNLFFRRSKPFVPRALTFEVPERIGAAGEVVKPLDEAAVVAITRRLAELEVEAVAVCLLWSIVNPAHELRVGELLAERLPGVPVTLSHRLNPALREYRRASSAAIDASLKPLMTSYLESLERRLREAGFAGRVLVVTSAGGTLDAADVAAAPIHSLNSGPAMAPLAGRHYAADHAGFDTAVVADTGGTSYDVSLVRRGRIPWTRETWLGEPYLGHMTGFPSVDVRSIGAGGGSIAWVDEGGLLHVGPQSAGSVPGPVCYGRGGDRPTVTDAALCLGYLDPEYFLGGAIRLDVAAAEAAVAREVGAPLGLDLHEAAAAVLRLATEHMVRAIEEITLHQGIDPRQALLVGGGGAAGLNSGAIARRLRSPALLIPETGAALSAAGALLSDLGADYALTFRTTTADFDAARVNELLAELAARCRAFAERVGAGAGETKVELAAEARYPHQIWELELPLRVGRFDSADDVERLRLDFHELHDEVFAISDPGSEVEIVSWRARVSCRLGSAGLGRLRAAGPAPAHAPSRRAYFAETGAVEARVLLFDELRPGERIEGPAIVESPVTTVVVEPGATVERVESAEGGSLLVVPPAAAEPLAPAREGAAA